MINKIVDPRKSYHYNLYQFQQRNSQRFGCNASRRCMDLPQQNKQNLYTFIDPTQYGYYLPLIPNQLQLTVYDEGNGNYPCPGQFINFKQRVYYQGDSRDIDRQNLNIVYGNKQNSQPIQLILGISKVRFKSKAILSWNLAQKMPCMFGKKRNNKVIIVQIQILFISDYPFQTDLRSLTNFYSEIVKSVIAADRAFQYRDLQDSLSNYQKAIQKIFSDYYNDTLAINKSMATKQENQEFRKKGITRQERQNIQLYGDLQSLVKAKKFIQQMEDFTQKATMKAIQVAFYAGQYFKVTRWAGIFLRNPKYQKSMRVLLTRSRAFLQLQQFDKALKDLKLLKLVYPEDQFINQQMKTVYDKKQNVIKKKNGENYHSNSNKSI